MVLVEEDVVDDVFDGLVDGGIFEDEVGCFVIEFECVVYVCVGD